MQKENLLIQNGIGVYTNEVKDSFAPIKSISDCYTVRYVKSGSADGLIEGGRTDFKQGSLFIIPPLSYHVILPNSLPYIDFAVTFRQKDISDEANSLLFKITEKSDKFGIRYFCGTHELHLNKLFDRFKEYSSFEIENKTAFLRIFVNELLLLLSECESDVAAEYGCERGAEYIDYINDFLYRNLSIKRLASRFFTNEFAICREFKSHNKISPHNYIVVKRILDAKKLIENGATPKIAAETVGFKTYSVFYRAYMKYIGNSPSTDKKGKEQV